MKYYLGFKFNEETTTRLQRLVSEYCSSTPPLVPTPADRLHVTTLFLGDVEEELARRVLRVSTCCRQFVVNVHETAQFPRVLYLQITDVHGHLHALHDMQSDAFRMMGGNPQSKALYVPHLTLAKAEGKMDQDQAKELRESMDTIASRISEFHLGQHLITTVGLYTKSDCIAEVRLLP